MIVLAALLGILNATDGQNVNGAVKRRARELQQKVSKFFSCWGITSLSVRGRVPFEPGLFDLVVIDEASQCDIASALPLLFRAKRSVIIGDPQQLPGDDKSRKLTKDFNRPTKSALQPVTGQKRVKASSFPHRCAPFLDPRVAPEPGDFAACPIAACAPGG